MSLAIGLVGVGPWGRHILRDLRSLGATVHAVARSPESVAWARDGGAASVIDHPDHLPPCDGYVVAVRTTSHLDVIDRLLPRGRPIFCEKPLSPDYARVKALPASARDLVFTMHKWRYHPGTLELARIARDGDLGAVTGLRTFRTGWSDNHPDTIPFWNLAPHDVSIALEIFDEVPDPIAAFSEASGDPGRGIVAWCRTASGVPFTFEVSARHPVNLRRVVLRCEHGACALDSSDYGVVTVRREGEAATQVRVADTMPLLAELDTFLSHLRGGPPPRTSLEEETAVLRALTRTLELARRS